MDNTQLLKSKIRSVTEEDRKSLPKYSYSGLSVLKQCPYQFNLKYNEKLVSSDTSLALQLGTLLHYILEQKGKMLTGVSGKVDYNVLSDLLQNGTTVTDEKTKEEILGLKELKRTYWESWGVPDSEGRNYNQKIELFLKVLSDEMENDEWQPFRFEEPFEFVYDDKIILHGFIDRIDKFEDKLRVIDYKTNKKLYNEKDLATSLQFGIYALACLEKFDSVPVEYTYRMILLDDKQNALTLGWEKRLIKALDKLVGELNARQVDGEWTPKPTPLCHWCNYCETNADAKEFKTECPYYSLWTPDNKTFEVNQKYEIEAENNTKEKALQNKRTVVF